jgi:dihydrofolate reductase
VGSWQEMIAALHSEPEIMIIGGAAIFQQALPFVTHMNLTFIDHEFVGDAFFPEWNANEWSELSREIHEPDDKNPYRYEFVDLEKMVKY